MAEDNSSLAFEKKIRLASCDPWVEVWAFSSERAPEPRAFQRSKIVHIDRAGDGASTLLLTSGGAIAVSLPYAELISKLSEDYSPIDLKPVVHAPVIRLPDTGGKMPDGSIYLGLIEGRDWFVAAEDRNVRAAFNESAAYAGTLKLHGHADWKLPPAVGDTRYPNILHVMYQHRNTGAFAGTYSECWYLSSTDKDGKIWQTYFSLSGDSRQSLFGFDDKSVSSRYVRSATRVRGHAP